MNSVTCRGFVRCVLLVLGLGVLGVTSACSEQTSPLKGGTQEENSRLAVVSTIASPTGFGAGGAIIDAGVGASDSAATIQAWIDANYYSDADIQYTFHSAFGERIDCIDFYAQRAVKSRIAAGKSVPTSPPPQNPDAPTPTQGFYTGIDENGQARGCVGTTVASMRPTVADVQAIGGIPAWTARGKRGLPRDNNESTREPDCYIIGDGGVLHGVLAGPNGDNNYDHAVAYQDVSNTGIYEHLTLAVPYLEYYYDHTDAQIWIQTGDCEFWVGGWSCSPAGDTDAGTNEAVQSLEVGWQVNPGQTMEGDYYTHLFMFYTRDGYHTSNVWNGEDGSFVPYYGGGPVLGAQLAESTSSPLTVVTVQVNSWLGNDEGEYYWWVFYNGYTIGYLPGDYYASGSLMASGKATRLQTGGEVFSGNPAVDYSLTEMGSGVLPTSSTTSTSAWVSNVQYIDGDTQTWYNMGFSWIDDLPTYEGDESKDGVCGYHAGYLYQKCNAGCAALSGGWGSYFYFGG